MHNISVIYPTKAYSTPAPKTDTQSLGLVAGVGAGMLVRKAFKPIQKSAAKSVIECGKLSDKDANNLKQCADEILIKTGLKDKGFDIFRVNEIKIPKGTKKVLFIKYDEKDNNIFKTIIDRQNKLPKNKNLLKYLNPFKPLKDAYNNYRFNMDYKSIKVGQNASCIADVKMIIAPEKSMQQALFHEIGHALNSESSALKTLSKFGKHNKAALIAVTVISLLNPKKSKENQEKDNSFIQKTADFIKRNAGKLVLLTFVPGLVEEANASIKGGKIAENLFKNGKISNDILNKIKNTHNKGFMTYATVAIATFCAIKTAIFVKDKIQENFEKK